MIGLILAQAAQETAEAVQKTNSNSPESLHVVLSKFFTEGQIVTMSIHLIGAVLLLLIGWLLAIILSKWVQKGIIKLSLKCKCTSTDSENSQKAKDTVALWAGRFVFYLILLITFIGFLNVFNLSVAAEPIKELLTTISGFGANIIGALLLLLLAWVIAFLIRRGAVYLMNLLKIDEKLNEHICEEGNKGFSISKTVGEVLYWLVFLCFIPGILGVLKINGIMEPFKGMVDKIFGYLPNLFSGILIFIVGVFAAKILRKVVTGVLAALKPDSVLNKVGFNKVFGESGIAKAFGILAYVMVLLPTIAIALNALNIEALSKPVSALISMILNASGEIFGAIVLIFVAHIIGRMIGKLVTQLLESCGFNRIFVAIRMIKEDQKLPENKTPSAIIGILVYICIIIFAAIAVADLLGFNELGKVIASFLPVAGRIILGLIVFMIGFFFAGLAADACKGKSKNAKLIGILARTAILTLVSAMALQCMGIAAEIIQIAFAAVIGAISLALALAFGIGGRDIAAKLLNEFYETLKNDKD